MDLYCLRVRRNIAGRKFPFDRVYLAKYGDHVIFKRLFRYAFILPVEGVLKETLYCLPIEDSMTHAFDRVETPEKIPDVEWKTLIDSTDWVLAVPILSKYVTANMPRYIIAKSTVPRRDKKNSNACANPFPNMTYLQTPEQNIRPICVACPNFIQHQNGHCELGDKLCYDSLSLGIRNHFEEGMMVPPAPEKEQVTEEGND
jgi:hypothetical protein